MVNSAPCYDIICNIGQESPYEMILTCHYKLTVVRIKHHSITSFCSTLLAIRLAKIESASISTVALWPEKYKHVHFKHFRMSSKHWAQFEASFNPWLTKIVNSWWHLFLGKTLLKQAKCFLHNTKQCFSLSLKKKCHFSL